MYMQINELYGSYITMPKPTLKHVLVKFYVELHVILFH